MTNIVPQTTLLMGEIDMLDRLEKKGIFLGVYNRYVDDIMHSVTPVLEQLYIQGLTALGTPT